MAQTVSKEDVVKISQLVKVDVVGQEERLANLFSKTLDYIKILEELDTSKVLETYQVTGQTNIYSEIQKGSQTLTKEEVLSNAKEVINGLIATKAVFDR